MYAGLHLQIYNKLHKLSEMVVAWLPLATIVCHYIEHPTCLIFPSINEFISLLPERYSNAEWLQLQAHLLWSIHTQRQQYLEFPPTGSLERMCQVIAYDHTAKEKKKVWCVDQC